MDTEDTSNERWRGFSAPLGERGQHALYGPPPWHFEGYSTSVSLRVDADNIRSLVPPELSVADDPVVRLTVFDFVCDCGHGEDFVQRYPDLAQQSEAVVGISVMHDGQPGYWPALLWCSSDAEMAVGREMYGWAQRLGTVALTRMPHRGWQRGDVVTAFVSRGHRSVFEFSINLAGTIESQPSDSGKMSSHLGRMPIYTQTALADPMRPGKVERRMVATDIEDVWAGTVWYGQAEVDLRAPELSVLREAEVVEGRWHPASWTKPYASRVVSASSGTV